MPDHLVVSKRKGRGKGERVRQSSTLPLKARQLYDGRRVICKSMP